MPRNEVIFTRDGVVCLDQTDGKLRDYDGKEWRGRGDSSNPGPPESPDLSLSP